MIISVALAIAFHELGHVLAILLTRAGEVKGFIINLKGFGVKWSPHAKEPLKRALVSLSGPAVNFALAAILYAAGYEFFALANMVFGVVNMLPLPGADGLRAFAQLKEAI